MEYNADGPVLKPLFIIGGDTKPEGSRRELFSLPNGKLLYEHSLQTLHEVLPRANLIYVSIQSETHRQSITTQNLQHHSEAEPSHHDSDHEHVSQKFPDLEFLPNDKEKVSNWAIAALKAAHLQFSDSKFLVTSCDYPLLGPAALQQLILEYEEPVTCFLNWDGIVQPLIGIWGPVALKKLSGSEGDLGKLVKELGGKVVKPLREEWVRGFESEKELAGMLHGVIG